MVIYTAVVNTTHHDIFVCWWNTYYQTSCLSADNKECDGLETAMKILQMNKKDGLPVKSIWFNHLPIHNEKYVPDKFRKGKYPYCLNYPLIKVDNKKLQQFESN